MDENIRYLGTNGGVFASPDMGKSWENLAGNSPTNYVQDLVVHPPDLIMVTATHGRGTRATDVKPIQELAKLGLEQPCTVIKSGVTMLPYGPASF